jgi:hypothetical protein
MKARTFGGLGLALFLITAPAAAIENRLGMGVHLWVPADDLQDHPGGWDDKDLTALLSYQLVLFRPLKLELDMEYFPNGFGRSGVAAVFPQGLIVVGDRVYAAVGAGWIYSWNPLGDFSDVLYTARLGVDVPVRDRLHLDVCAGRQEPDLSKLSEIRKETVTFAAVLRVRL